MRGSLRRDGRAEGQAHGAQALGVELKKPTVLGNLLECGGVEVRLPTWHEHQWPHNLNQGQSACLMPLHFISLSPTGGLVPPQGGCGGRRTNHRQPLLPDGAVRRVHRGDRGGGGRAVVHEARAEVRGEEGGKERRRGEW